MLIPRAVWIWTFRGRECLLKFEHGTPHFDPGRAKGVNVYMQALVKLRKGYDQMQLVDIPEPQTSGNLVKIKVAYAGICGTDIHTFEGVYAANKPPVVLGHEFSGVVTQVGELVETVKIGDRVTSETTFSVCGACEFCREREYNLCADRKGMGTQADGGFAEYVIAPESSVHVLPPEVGLLAAAVTEPLACCVHGALEKTSVKPGDVALVFGPGAMGLLCSQLLLSQGVRVILAGVTRDAARLELAKAMGVELAVDQLTQDLAAIVDKQTNGRGVDRVFECSGVVAALNTGLRLAAKKADVVQLGVFKEDMNLIDTSVFFPREIRYIGSRTQKPSSWETALELMRMGAVKPELVVTRTIPLEDWRTGFALIRDCAEVKVVVQMQ